MNVPTKQFLHTAAFSTQATGLPMLDPFSDSGSTGVNAIKHGRKCILIEQTEAAIELTVKRLEHALEERAKRHNPIQGALRLPQTTLLHRA
jgi:DNA modification methylase